VGSRYFYVLQHHTVGLKDSNLRPVDPQSWIDNSHRSLGAQIPMFRKLLSTPWP